MIINEKTWEFIWEHANDDVRKLALKGTKDKEVDLPMALQQIAGRQTASRKLPSWAAIDKIIYPPHLNMEQCSSELTARYKAQLVKDGGCSKTTFVDLTGGFGVDFYWMSQGFSQRFYVEQNAELCAISSENFRSLGLACSVCCCNTATYLTEMPHADVIYLDPARRDNHGARTYSINDCTPNVLELLPQLLQKSNCIIVKLSPMLDWRKAIGDFGGVSAVHIISVDNECKELLLVVKSGKMLTSDYQVHCINLQTNGEIQFFCFTPNTQTSLPLTSHSSPLTSHFSPLTSHFLYEPNASLMKAGCFLELAESYHIQQLAPNSHLFLSCERIMDFPGREFQVLAISSVNQKDLKRVLSERAGIDGQTPSSMESANIAVRNFPLSADQLRKKLKLKDGGDCYIFATTLADGQHKLFICRKIG